METKQLIEYCDYLKNKLNPNKNVLLIAMPQFEEKSFEIEVAKNKGYYIYNPTGLQYLSAEIIKNGFYVEILDLNYELLKKIQEIGEFKKTMPLEIVKQRLDTKDFSIVGLSNLFPLSREYFKEIGKFLVNNKKIVIAGGHDVTYNSEIYLREKVCHLICKRESEQKMICILDLLLFGGNKTTKGIVFESKGEIIESQGDEKNIDVNVDIMGTYNLIKIEDYNNFGCLSPLSRMAGKNKRFAGVLLNRGCRGNCRFCDVAEYMGRGIRSKKAENFINEIEYLYKEKEIEYFEFLDDDFLADKNLAKEVLKEIIKKGLKINWGSINGMIAVSCDEEIMDLFRKSGCIGFNIGVESGNKDVLIRMKKIGTLKSFKEFSERAMKFPELFIVDNYVIGLPEETFEQILNSFNFSIDMNLDWSSYSVYKTNVSYSEQKIKESGDFKPTKDFLKGKFKSENVKMGLEIFSIDKGDIPDRYQLYEIWFTFNLLRNFIFNKNIFNNTSKYLKWLKVLEDRYPTHPYVTLFLGFAYGLNNDIEKSDFFYTKTKQNIQDSYWHEKMKKFGLIEIMENPPMSKEEAEKALESLKKRYAFLAGINTSSD